MVEFVVFTALLGASLGFRFFRVAILIPATVLALVVPGLVASSHHVLAVWTALAMALNAGCLQCSYLLGASCRLQARCAGSF